MNYLVLFMKWNFIYQEFTIVAIFIFVSMQRLLLIYNLFHSLTHLNTMSMFFDKTLLKNMDPGTQQEAEGIIIHPLFC